MATIEKRTTSDGETRYKVKIRLRGQRPVSRTFRRKTDANDWAKERESSMRRRRDFPEDEARKHTLADAIKLFVEDELPGMRPGTANTYRTILKLWSDEIGCCALDTINASVVKTVLRKWKRERPRSGRVERLSPTTINHRLALLRTVFEFVRREGWTALNPAEHVKREEQHNERVRFLSHDERQRLFDACGESESGDLQAAVLVSISTGLRKGELLSITWRQVDLKNGRITLDDPDSIKNKSRRVAHLSGPALEAMRERKAKREGEKANEKVVVLAGRKRNQMDLLDEKVFPRDFRKSWETARKRAELVDFHWHDLRHTFASYLAQNGASLVELSEAMGHKTLQMVKRYAHLGEAHTASVVEKMTKKIFGSGK